ncbi:MAG: HAMP domain-containing protein, partial [Spirochaetaceae bacterium]|nr:HAMP domain-containing protein [Spirochaetaceae bacterium]
MQFRSIRTRLGFWFMFMFLIALIAFALVLSIQRIADTEDRSEIFAPMRSMPVSAAIGLSTLLILAHLVVRRLSMSLTSPVLSMAKTMREMKAGDFAARSTVERSDEIGFLADSFNALADIIVGQLAVKQDVARITEGLASASDLQTAVSTLVYALVETTGSNLGAVFLMNEKTRKL